MHSRIFKLQPYYKEKEYSEISESTYYDNGFLNTHDYVQKSDDYEDDYEWLNECSYANVYKEGDYYYLKITKEDVKEALERNVEAMKAELSKGLDDIDYYKLQCYLNCEDEFYFEIFDDYQTEMEFLRHLYKEPEDEITFRLEGTLDYHC